MATTITAPVVPAPASGQQNVQQYVESTTGKALPDIVGASTTAAGNIKIDISGPDEAEASVTIAAAANAYTTAGKFQYIPNKPGLYKITVTDVTAGETAETTVEVFEG